MRDVYSQYWITAREKIYGFLEYDKNLCNYICEQNKGTGKLLDVAIGTGYPFGNCFVKMGYSVYGIDISPDLIEKCKQLNPNINCKIGDAENIDYPNDYFDCTYCFHSSWYFTNLSKVIDEMLRVTCSGGLVMFDIQNRSNKKINKAYRRCLSPAKGIKKIVLYTKNVIKVILGRGSPIWQSFVHEVPTYPEEIYKYFKERQINKFRVMVRKEDESVEIKDRLSSFKDFERLVFIIRK